MDIGGKYLSIMQGEIGLIKPREMNHIVYDVDFFHNLARRVLENALSSTQLRCCGTMGHLTDANTAYESVAAHTNLVCAIVDYALDLIYEQNLICPRYSRRDIVEAVRMHDLPENVTGDTPDNSTRDEDKKDKEDSQYYRFYHELGPKEFRRQSDSLQILNEMQNKSSSEGRIIYLADKLAAIIMTLCYDKIGLSPIASSDDPGISAKNRCAMILCDHQLAPGYYLLSEVWTIDFLVQRELTKYDEIGFFTALLVMSTLICHDLEWYYWRETQYMT